MKTTPMRTNESAAGSTRLLHRLTAALLALVLAASAALPVFAADTAPTDTIYINSVSDLLAFADKCGFDQWSKGKTVILQEDLSLEDTEWAPVASFSGAFKGNGHTISDVSLVGAYSPAGFFGILEEGGSIQDLTIKGVVNPAGTQKTAGGLVGTNYGTIINCTFSGAVHGEEEAGGLVGRNETSGTIDHSTSRAMVSGAYATGGIVGYNLGVITGCTNVGAVNSEYQESALDMEGLPATLLELVKKDMGDDLSNNISNVSSDTGGIAGRSSGLILSSANAGDVGYAHVGYNVGGIVGRTDGLISGCVNQGLVQGRKDVGGIAGQAEPYVELDLDQSTINRLRTELDTLHTMVNGAADDMDGSTSLLNTDLNTLNSQMDTAVQAARRLQEQGGDYFDEVADEVDRTGDLISDTFTRLEPVMDTGVDALDKMTTAVGQLKWVTAEMAAEMLTASTALAKASSGAHKASDALDSSKQGLEQISKGLDDLIASLPGKDDSGLSSAISTILGGYSSVSGDAVDDHIKTAISLLQVANSAMSILSLGSGMSGQMKLLTTGLGLLRSATLLADDGQLASAGKQVTRAVGNMAGRATQIGALLGNTANLVSEQGNPQMASALTSMSGALGNVGDQLGNLEDILDKLGFNTGNISSGNASIQAGLDSLSDAAQDLGKAADDFDKSLDILKTDSALTSATLGHMSASLGIMAEGMSGLTSMTSQAADIVHWLAEQDPIHVPRPSSEMTATKDELFDAVTNMTDQMSTLNRDMLSASNTLTSNLRSINDQINVVSNLLLDAVEEISDPGSKTIYEDESEDLIASQSDGKIENSINRGSIDADMNVGGIAGTMGVENLLDPEEDNKDEGTSLLRTSYTVSAVLTGNINEGSITAKKDMVGGIVGQEELGLVTACESYGDVTGVNQVGGIAGAASAKLRSNWAKCALSGEKYIGGIVGQGTDSDLTDGSLIAINNRAIVSVLEGQQYVGAVSGGQDGDFYGNLFVSDDLQGIDRLSRVGQAEPVTYETLLAQENVPDSFRKLTLTFKADGHIIKKISFDYGASFTLDDYPEIPQKNGYYAEWSTPVLDQLHTDTVVNVEYTPYIPSLSSSVTRENGRPVFFVDGFFGGSNAVQVTQQDITADVHGVTEQWLLEFTDDGNETHQIRYLTPGKAKGKVYVKQADGSWHKVETGSFGSYTTFTTTGTEVEVAFVPAKLPIWAFCAGGAALLVLLLLLAKRIKSKHGPKGEKPLKEKKGKQPEMADTPADELDTPISETDMQ